VAPHAFLEHHPESGRALHVDNGPYHPRFFEVIVQDSEPYFRFYRERGPNLQHLHAYERGGRAFSYLFPRSWAYGLSYLSSEYDLDAVRPHWVKDIPCAKLDEAGLDLLGVKYLVCRMRRGQPVSRPGWEHVTQDRRDVLLRRQGYRSGIRYYCSWSRTGSLSLGEARGPVLRAFEERRVLLDREAGEPPAGPDGRCPGGAAEGVEVRVLADRPGAIDLAVDAPRPGVVVVPDNYAPGWRAEVDGGERAVLRAFMAHMAVAVDGGKSVIRFRYTDPWVRLGASISVVTAILLLVYGVGATLALRRRGAARER
jgi:hypothetical protein